MTEEGRDNDEKALTEFRSAIHAAENKMAWADIAHRKDCGQLVSRRKGAPCSSLLASDAPYQVLARQDESILDLL